MPSENKPKVSVVIPVYNQAHLISNAINSILNQTFQDFEIVIINDGSTDNLKDVVFKFKDERIRLINQEHMGLVVARNFGNYCSRADVIVIQDADDLSMPDRLEKCYKEIQKGSDVVYHGAYINMWESALNCIGRKYLPANKPDKKTLLKGQYIPGWPMFKKNVWKKKSFRLETQYAYDWMMYLDWLFSDFKFKAINEGLYEYVRHENSASINFEKLGWREQSIKKIKEIMKEEYDKS